MFVNVSETIRIIMKFYAKLLGAIIVTIACLGYYFY